MYGCTTPAQILALRALADGASLTLGAWTWTRVGPPGDHTDPACGWDITGQDVAFVTDQTLPLVG